MKNIVYLCGAKTNIMKHFFIILLSFAVIQANAQDLPHFKRIVKELSSSKYQGRGYARGGANKAGKYLEKQFRKAGADEVTLQPFTIDINTFPGAVEMWADGKKLRAGIDFSMREYSPGVRGEFPVYHVDTLNFDGAKLLADLEKPENAGSMVCCDFWFTYKHREVFSKLQKAGACPNAGLIYTWAAPIKFFKAYGEKVVDKPIIWVTPEERNTTVAMSLRPITTTLATWGVKYIIPEPMTTPPAPRQSLHWRHTMPRINPDTTCISLPSPEKTPTCGAQLISPSIPLYRSAR